MPNKSIKALRNLTLDELNAKKRDLEKDLFESRMKKTTGQLTNPNHLWKTRKDLARTLMLISQMSSAPKAKGSAKKATQKTEAQRSA